MTKTRENTMADGRENAMAEEKKGNVEAEMRDSIWSVPFVVLMEIGRASCRERVSSPV